MMAAAEKCFLRHNFRYTPLSRCCKMGREGISCHTFRIHPDCFFCRSVVVMSFFFVIFMTFLQQIHATSPATRSSLKSMAHSDLLLNQPSNLLMLPSASPSSIKHIPILLNQSYLLKKTHHVPTIPKIPFLSPRSLPHLGTWLGTWEK
jgi:hypothetical protein